MKINTPIRFERRVSLSLPLFGATVRAGFPSPADDHLDKALDLNEHLIDHPAATFFCRAKGDSMIGDGIMDGTILVVDRSVQDRKNRIVVAAINGELTCKRLDVENKQLISSNPKYPPIKITEDIDLIVEGVVTSWVTESHVCPS